MALQITDNSIFLYGKNRAHVFRSDHREMVLPDGSEILVAKLSPSAQFLCFCCEDKSVRIFKFDPLTNRFEPQKKFGTVRRASVIQFEQRGVHRGQIEKVKTEDGDAECSVVIADKSGYVYRFPLSCDDAIPVDTEKTEIQEDEEKWMEFVICGHISMITDIALNPSQTLLASADRDEKIRISRFPEAYVIHGFLLGHTAFIVQLHFSENKQHRHVLFSVDGDGTMIAWDAWKLEEFSRINLLPLNSKKELLEDDADTTNKTEQNSTLKKCFPFQMQFQRNDTEFAVSFVDHPDILLGEWRMEIGELSVIRRLDFSYSALSANSNLQSILTSFESSNDALSCGDGDESLFYCVTVFNDVDSIMRVLRGDQEAENTRVTENEEELEKKKGFFYFLLVLKHLNKSCIVGVNSRDNKQQSLDCKIIHEDIINSLQQISAKEWEGAKEFVRNLEKSSGNHEFNGMEIYQENKTKRKELLIEKRKQRKRLHLK